MEKQVIFRDQQEFQAADPNNLQTFTADTIKHALNDAVSSALHYTGLGVTPQGSNTALDIAIGRIYNAGQIYTLDQATILDLFAELPLTTQKIVAVVAWGQTVDTDIQPRDFLIDLAAGTTQPQAVAMQRLNQAVINIVPGVESASPQPPTIQSGTLAVALVTLDPTGITNITMQTGNQLPNANDHEHRLKAQEIWKGQAEPRISSIATDLSALASKAESMAKAQSLVDAESEIARLKEQLNLPTAFAASDADDFSDASKSDTAHAGFAALIAGGGILFPHTTETIAPVDSFNPTDPAITRTAGGMILPKYTDAVALAVAGYAGDISISQYQSQAITMRRRTITTSELHYGYSWQYIKYWSIRKNQVGTKDHTLYYGYHPFMGYRKRLVRHAYYNSSSVVKYLPETTTTTINGALVAQTFLASNASWLTKIGLQFTGIGTAGDVHLLVCETVGGKPDVDQVVTDVTIPVADLKQHPTETAIAVPPALLEAGKRYAIVLVTQGAHRVAIVSGNKLTAGTLFNGTDGDYFTGDLTKDLMFTIYAAQFDSPRTEVALQSVSLAGGIEDLDLNVQSVVPDGTELSYEVQIGGIWYRLDDGINHLTGSPAIVPMRAVFLGTNDLAPALKTGVNLLTASRPTVAGEHWSVARNLAAPTTSLQVDLIVDHNYDAATDTCVASIESGGTSNAATLVETLPQADGSIRLRHHFTTAAISTYQIKTITSRGAASIPFAIGSRVDVAL